MINILLFILLNILKLVISSSYLPIFTSLPPPLIYYSTNENSEKIISCKAWPFIPELKIKFYSTARVAYDLNGLRFGNDAAPLHPVDSDLINDNNEMVLRNIQQVRRLSKLDLHCLVKTEFGAVISRPFRIIEPSIGAFASPLGVSSGEAQNVIKTFIGGNVAYVICNPPESFPPAKIEFRINGTTLTMSSRYRYISRSNSRQVTMLIHPFELKDQGYYRCVATNTITGEQRIDPVVQQLKILNPNDKMQTRVRLSLTGQEYTNSMSMLLPPSSHYNQLHVRQGRNLTLFCVMEGAPPPRVTTYKMHLSDSSVSRHIADKDFGLLTITNVDEDDSDNYVCSDTGFSDNAKLVVKKRLSIKQGPKDIRLPNLGMEARFTCISSDPTITPHWYFNGRIRSQSSGSGADSSLHIVSVRREDLGVYQCVARSHDEWVTQIATLSLKDDPVIRQNGILPNPLDNDKAEVIDKSDKLNQPPLIPPTNQLANPERGSRIKKEVHLANMAGSFLPWDSSSQQQLNGYSNSSTVIDEAEQTMAPLVEYLFDNLAVLLKWVRPARIVVKYYRVQYRERRINSQIWSAIRTLDAEVPTEHFYVTSQYLQAQHTYQFRISTVTISGELRSSHWSREISFEHIYADSRPIVSRLEPLGSRLRVYWNYLGDAAQPITQWRILIRPVEPQGDVGRYRTILIQNGKARDAVISNLNAHKRYQLVVYGLYVNGPQKMVTQFSPEAAVTLPKSAGGLWPEINSNNISPLDGNTTPINSRASTHLMFIILGSLAGLMALVIVVLIVMCYCRERNSGRARLNRYKDPAKLLHEVDVGKSNGPNNSSFLLASITAAVNGNNNTSCNKDASMLHHHMQQQQQQQQEALLENSAMSHSNNNNNNHDDPYCQQKRQPPSGGSGHDLSDGAGGTVPRGATGPIYHDNSMGGGCGGTATTTTMATSCGVPPSVTYYYQQQQQQQQQQHRSGNSSLARTPNNNMAGQMMYSPSPHGGMMLSQNYYPGSGGAGPMMYHGGVSSHSPGDLKSQDGGESVYSYFSQQSNAMPGGQSSALVIGNSNNTGHNPLSTNETGSQTISGPTGCTNNANGMHANGNNSTHRHHRRKRRRTQPPNQIQESGAPGTNPNYASHPIQHQIHPNNGLHSSPPPQMMIINPHMSQQYHQHYPNAPREVMYDTPPGILQSGSGQQMSGPPPPGMVLVSPHQIMSHHQMMNHQQQQQQQHAQHMPHHLVQSNNTLTRRGTPTLFVEPPRIRDYTEYGIPHGCSPQQQQQIMIQQQQQQPVAIQHLSQQNLHLHNQAQMMARSPPPPASSVVLQSISPVNNPAMSNGYREAQA